MANASIYSEFVKANKPFATLGEIAAQKQERETTRLNQEIAKTNLSEVQRKAAAAAKAEAQAAARQQLVQSAVQKYTRPDGSFDQRGALAEIRAADYEAGDAFEAHLADTHKKAQDARKVELDNQDKTWGLIAQSLQSVTPQTYRPIWSRINSMDPEMGAFLGPEYDPAKVQTALAAGTSRTEYNNAYKTILSEKKDAKEKTLGLLAIAKDPEHWQDALDFAELNGVADDIKAMGLEQFTPDAPERVAQFIMGPKEVAGLAEQKADNERQASQFAQSNAIARGQLDVSRGNLAVAQGNLAQRKAEGASGSGAGGAKLSAAAVEKVAGVDQSLSMIADIDRMLPNMKNYIGILDGRMAGARLATGKGVTPQLAEFDAQITGLKNAVIKATTGAAMSEPEAKRIMGQLPDLTLPEAVFKARLETTKRNLEMLKKRIIELSGGSVSAPAATGTKTKVGRFEVEVEP